MIFNTAVEPIEVDHLLEGIKEFIGGKPPCDEERPMPDENGWILMSEREPTTEEIRKGIECGIFGVHGTDHFTLPEFYYKEILEHSLPDAWRPFIPPQRSHEKCKGCGDIPVLHDGGSNHNPRNTRFVVRCSGYCCWASGGYPSEVEAWAAWDKVMGKET